MDKETQPKQVTVFEASDGSLHKTLEQYQTHELQLRMQAYNQEILGVCCEGNLWANTNPGTLGAERVRIALPHILKTAHKYGQLPIAFHCAVVLQSRLKKLLARHVEVGHHKSLLQELGAWHDELEVEISEAFPPPPEEEIDDAVGVDWPECTGKPGCSCEGCYVEAIDKNDQPTIGHPVDCNCEWCLDDEADGIEDDD